MIKFYKSVQTSGDVVVGKRVREGVTVIENPFSPVETPASLPKSYFIRAFDSIDIAPTTIELARPSGVYVTGDELTLLFQTTLPVSLIFASDTLFLLGYSSALGLALPSFTSGGNKIDDFRFRYSGSGWYLWHSSQQAPAQLSATTISIDLGNKPLQSGNFQIVGTNFTTGRQLIISQATGVGAAEDDAEWDGIVANCVTRSAVLAQCYWSSQGYVLGQKRFNYIEA